MYFRLCLIARRCEPVLTLKKILPACQLLVLLTLSSMAFAQLPGALSGVQTNTAQLNSGEAELLSEAASTESVALDAHTPVVSEQESFTVLGQNLFNGSFGRQQFTGFNPNYRIAVGDKVLLQLWGAVESQGQQTVDPQGNIFIPQVGPVNIAGVLNSELNTAVAKALGRIYKKDVHVYASLVGSQPVKVFVTGNVINPGLYSGLSSDSILSYLDRAGGIDPMRGSYLDIVLKRAGKAVESYNLYDFLVRGEIPQRQLYEGDVLVVGSRKSVINFSGMVENPYQIEFATEAVELSQACSWCSLCPAPLILR